MNEGAGDGLEHDESGRRRPRFSIVTAVYNVSRYLDDFIASIEAQDFDLDELEVVMIDDGSTDDSLEVLTAWAQRRPELVQVHTKVNGGQGSARNAGLGYATGAWVTFLDPDDTIKVDYLSRVSWAIDKEPTIEMIAANRILHFEETGEFAARHPLRAMFAHRDQFRDLDRFPDFFYGSAPAAFFRLDHIRQLELTFDERIQPNFEDGHFCQRYLLGADRPFVAFLKTAEYYYRKRLDQSSTLQTGSLRPSRYIEVPQHGYLELLQEAAERYGRAPEWLQNMIIYELSYYISPEDSSWNTATACHGVVAERFVEIARQIRRELDENVIRSFTVRNLRSEWRQLLLYGLAEGDWHTPYVVAHRYDRRRDQALVSFRFTGREPRLAIYVDGEQVQPTASKRRSFVYWDHTLMQERMCWIAAAEGDALRFSLDDTMVELRTNWTDFRPSSIRPYALRRRFGAGLLDPEPAVSEQKALEQAAAEQKERVPVRDRALTSLRALHLPKPSESAGLIKRIGTSTAAKSRFADAWVLMDRVSDSGDSAERLFEYLRANHPDTINAWFVVERDTRLVSVAASRRPSSSGVSLKHLYGSVGS